MQPSLLLQECSTHFYVGEGNPYPCLCMHYFLIFHALCLTFHAFHACCSFLSLTHLTHMCLANGANGVNAFSPFDALFMCFLLLHLRC